MRSVIIFTVCQIQVTLLIRLFDIRVFAYTWFYFSKLSLGASISFPQSNFKACYLHRTFSRLIRECDADELSVKEFWRQF
jgi:hypothetical protein